jgi:hypothetical protein
MRRQIPELDGLEQLSAHAHTDTWIGWARTAQSMRRRIPEWDGLEQLSTHAQTDTW